MPNNKNEQVLKTLYKCRFATITQLMRKLQFSRSKVVRLLDDLKADSYIHVRTETKPYAYGITVKGCSVLGLAVVRQGVSSAAVHQYLMRNELESELAAKVISRKKVNEFGLQPAIGEHLFKMDDQLKLIIIDDFGFNIRKLNHTLTRKHKSTANDQVSSIAVNWSGFIDAVSIYTTSQSRYENFKYFLDQQNMEMNIGLKQIRPVWDVL